MKKSKGIIGGLQAFMDSAKGKTIMNYFYSWGAAVVILGTLFKLTHLPGADIMLFVGMGTEVIVFIFSAFERPFEVEEESGSSVANTTGGATGGQPIIINGPIMAGGPVGGTAPVIREENDAIDAPVIPTTTDSEHAPATGPIVIGGGAPAAMGGAPVVIGGGAPAAMGGAPVVMSGEAPAAMGGAPVVMGGAAPAAMGGVPVVAPANIEEMDKATEEYVEKVRELTEAIHRISQHTEALGRSMEEMDTLSRNLTGVNALYEVHLRSAGGQLNAIDQVNDQTKKMAQQIEELNNLYARMIEAMTSRIDRPQI